MPDQTWSDGNIEQLAREIGRQEVAPRVQNGVHNALLGMKTHYERRIAELEAQLAGRSEWVPVEDVVVHCVHGAGSLQVGKDGNLQATGKHGPTAAVDVTLPEWFAFCRRTRSENAP